VTVAAGDRSSKQQAPSSREIPNIKIQKNRAGRDLNLVLRDSLELGAWILEL
jgi:hypothetical protein